jgi:hypothetical protein
VFEIIVGARQTRRAVAVEVARFIAGVEVLQKLAPDVEVFPYLNGETEHILL